MNHARWTSTIITAVSLKAQSYDQNSVDLLIYTTQCPKCYGFLIVFATPHSFVHEIEDTELLECIIVPFSINASLIIYYRFLDKKN